jgi:hypothetical protein
LHCRAKFNPEQELDQPDGLARGHGVPQAMRVAYLETGLEFATPPAILTNDHIPAAIKIESIDAIPDSVKYP